MARWVWVLFASGLALSVVMAFRSQVGGDQLKHLILGWHLYAEGTVLPFGSGLSRGGLVPGPMSGIFVGLPLFLWEDYRSASLVTVACHVVAFLLLDSVLKRAAGGRVRLLFCLFYWLNPWRMYHSAHLWNPNWIFMFGALHAWSAFHMRRSPSFAMSFVHVLGIGIAFQLHGSFLTLAVISTLLFFRGYVRVHWGGAILGGVVALAALIPWFLEAARNPDILPMHGGFVGRGFFLVYPVVRGICYWLRFPTLFHDKYMTHYDFAPELGAEADAVLHPLMVAVTWVTRVTIVVAVIGNVWLWRVGGRASLRSLPANATDRDWVFGLARWGLVGAALTFGLSFTTIVRYHVFIVMHLAVLPVVFWLAHWSQSLSTRWATRGAALYAAVLLPLLLAQAFAGPMYRTGGRNPRFAESPRPRTAILLVQDRHPVLDDLRISDRVPFVVDPIWGVATDPLHHAKCRDDRDTGRPGQ